MPFVPMPKICTRSPFFRSMPRVWASLLRSAEIVAPESTTNTKESHSPARLRTAPSAAGKRRILPVSSSVIPYGKRQELGMVDRIQAFRDDKEDDLTQGALRLLFFELLDHLGQGPVGGDNLAVRHGDLLAPVFLDIDDGIGL